VVQAYYNSYTAQKLTRRELLVLAEIGDDAIDSASSFVSYMSESYGFSKSSVWYNLNKLRELGLVEFEPHKELRLTANGIMRHNSLGSNKTRLIDMFSSMFLERLGERNSLGFRGELERVHMQ